jgi:hypothetical protein
LTLTAPRYNEEEKQPGVKIKLSDIFAQHAFAFRRIDCIQLWNKVLKVLTLKSFVQHGMGEGAVHLQGYLMKEV